MEIGPKKTQKMKMEKRKVDISLQYKSDMCAYAMINIHKYMTHIYHPTHLFSFTIYPTKTQNKHQLCHKMTSKPTVSYWFL